VELLDVYDPTGERHLGTKPRDAVHRDGDWHRCFHLWVVTADGVLLQRRSRAKEAFPGMLDATAAGHLVAGEQVADGLREVEEELGATWPLEALSDLGVHRVDDHPTPATTNREFQHVFAVFDDRPLTAWTALHRDEVDGLVLVGHDGLGALLSGGRCAAREWDGTAVRDVEVDAAELVPAPYLAGIAGRLRDEMRP
jgi:isopentenyldiphosphate isomerase